MADFQTPLKFSDVKDKNDKERQVIFFMSLRRLWGIVPSNEKTLYYIRYIAQKYVILRIKIEKSYIKYE